MPIRRYAHISRAFVQANRQFVFVFGDNVARRGFGGQAAEMRGEPNTIGIPTKMLPDTTPDAYLTDNDEWLIRPLWDAAFAFLGELLRRGTTIIVSEAGIGGGLAEMPARAPGLYRDLVRRFAAIDKWAEQYDRPSGERVNQDGSRDAFACPGVGSVGVKTA